MLKSILCSLALIAIASCKVETDEDPKIWALLVAGSNTYYNYRHQADVCHAYQILHKHGIPDERIVVMMYDDIANNSMNPTPGIIINHPKGGDVYHGVPKDYTGKDVTPEVFMKVMQGIDPGVGSGKVIKSGPNDHVFVNFVDHGAPGILAFPYGAPTLTVKELTDTLNDMHSKSQFKKLVFYVEACESGSMFHQHLSPNISVYATTAANYKESSYACYYDSQRNTYLGDLYSVKWMEDSDKENLDVETLFQQYSVTKKETTQSHVIEHGDLSMSSMPVGDFQGMAGAKGMVADVLPEVPLDAVPSREVPLSILYHRMTAEYDTLKRDEINNQLSNLILLRQQLKMVINDLVEDVVPKGLQQAIMTQQVPITDLECHHSLIKAFEQSCLQFSKSSYATKYVYILANMCEFGIPAQQVITAFEKHCPALQNMGDIV